MIQINTKLEPRIAENFPNDPYANVCILTSTNKLNLQLAFLAMDSEFFYDVAPDTREIDLTFLPEEPLIQVIRGLYGEQLSVNNLKELAQIYPIIQYLRIEEFKENISNEIKRQKNILESLEFLELSYKLNFMRNQVIETHLENKLKFLQESKNYLQLNKISNQNFNKILLEFVNISPEADWPIINNAMENYFTRNNIKAVAYLQNPALSKLQMIWQKYHHVYFPEFELTCNDSTVDSQIFSKSNNNFQATGVRSRKSTEGNFFNKKNSLEDKKKKEKELEKQLVLRDNEIYELTIEIEQLKDQIRNKKTNQKQDNNEKEKRNDEENEMSTNAGDMPIVIGSMKKYKRQSMGMSTSIDFDVNEQAFQQSPKRIPESKQFKTLSKVSKPIKKF